jgi:hypothetical protein
LAGESQRTTNVEQELAIRRGQLERAKYDPCMRAVGQSLNVGSQAAGYAAALAIPVGITYAVAWLGWPPFIFEHFAVLLVVAIAASLSCGPGDRRGSDVRRRGQCAAA